MSNTDSKVLVQAHIPAKLAAILREESRVSDRPVASILRRMISEHYNSPTKTQR